jgi:hypothetical protein
MRPERSLRWLLLIVAIVGCVFLHTPRVAHVAWTLATIAVLIGLAASIVHDFLPDASASMRSLYCRWRPHFCSASHRFEFGSHATRASRPCSRFLLKQQWRELGQIPPPDHRRMYSRRFNAGMTARLPTQLS